MSEIDQLRADMLREFGAMAKRFEKLEDTVVRESKLARQAASKVVDRQSAIETRVGNHARRLRAVEAQEEIRSSKEPGPNWTAESTGVHNLAVLVEERADRRSEAKALRRQARGWIVGAIGWVVALIVTTAVASYVASARASAPASHSQGAP